MSSHSDSSGCLENANESNPISQATTQSKKRCRFYGCYLLTSISTNPRSFNRTYIGFTVDPIRRLRQHNGLIVTGGAHRTKRHRPWRLIGIIHGFSSQTQGLQFEWAWQHPLKTLSVRLHGQNNDALPLPNTRRSSVRGCLMSLAALTSVPPWSNCPLTFTVCAERESWETYGIATLSFPKQLEVQFSSLDSLKHCIKEYSYKRVSDSDLQRNFDKPCPECLKPVNQQRKRTYCPQCGVITHLVCLVKRRMSHENVDTETPTTLQRTVVPTKVRCSDCNHELAWSLVVRMSRMLESENENL